MADQNRNIGTGSAHCIEVFGERLEPPVDAGAQGVEIHAFDNRKIAHDQVGRCGGDGTIPKPQLPVTTVVTPSDREGDIVGSQVTCAS